MGSSSRKKKEKKKDFQKPKLKVGKTRAKVSNFTDTSFKSKSIVVNQQSLTSDGADPVQHFRSQLSQAATARSDGQRRDALSYLCNQLSAQPPRNALGTRAVLARTLPLVTDGSASVRTQLLRLFRALPPAEVRPHADQVLMYVRSGMTHLSSDVRADTLAVLDWLLDAAADEAVSCPGGWLKTLNSLSSMLGWNPSVGAATSTKGWTSVSRAAMLPTTAGAAPSPLSSSSPPSSSSSALAATATFVVKGKSKGGGGGGGGAGETQARQIRVLAKFLQAGFRAELRAPHNPRAYWDNIYRLPRGGGRGGGGSSSPFAYLNLFGALRDEEGEMYPDRTSRLRVFDGRWRAAIVAGMEDAKREGGSVGRAAAALNRVLVEGFGGEAGVDGSAMER